MTAPLRLESKDGIATITLAQPERMNALNFEMLEALIEALDAVRHSDDRVLVLAAEGRAFCAGADRAEMIERKPAEWEPIVDRYLDPVRRIADLDIPVIAKLQGDTVGGGFGLAICSDFRVAAEGIRLGAPFVRIGLAGCDMSAGYYLPRLIPLGAATEMMMTGKLVRADEALTLGLVHRVVAPEALDAEVDALAAKLRAGPPIALAFTKRAIRRSLDLDRDAEFDYEVFAQVNCIQTEDHQEGVRAFFDEKRTPAFEGR
ncbi:MAG: enoyl-CoA hydratase/isomerase family protein [Deltaproteobacteria bacterium]|nr:enoyl-CoA hydratase/isomerase family protein [Deltaproteobacteria bacterium]MBW2445538.1 enoyl-CoA hydratase/isomerase family protein [Deltaproteobacteria bacterium]